MPAHPGLAFRTSDIYLAAYLKIAGVDFQGVTHEGTRAFFLFENQEGLDEIKQAFFAGTSKVPARAYAEEIKAFKSMVYGGTGRS